MEMMLGGLSGLAGAGNEAHDFANDEHRAGDGGKDKPLLQAEGLGTEDIAAELNGQHLAEEDDRCNEQEALVAQNATQAALVGAIHASVEEVPELQPHKAGEEQRDVMSGGVATTFGGDVNDIGDKGRNEGYTEAENPLPHIGGNDKGYFITRRTIHHIVTGRLGSERESGEGIHNQVNPQHLGDGEGQVNTDEGPEGGNTAGSDVHRELEHDKLLDIAVEGAPPLNGSGDTGEGVVEQDDVGGLLGNRSTGNPHGKAYIGVVEGDARNRHTGYYDVSF